MSKQSGVTIRNSAYGEAMAIAVIREAWRVNRLTLNAAREVVASVPGRGIVTTSTPTDARKFSYQGQMYEVGIHEILGVPTAVCWHYYTDDQSIARSKRFAEVTCAAVKDLVSAAA